MKTGHISLYSLDDLIYYFVQCSVHLHFQWRRKEGTTLGVKMANAAKQIFREALAPTPSFLQLISGGFQLTIKCVVSSFAEKLWGGGGGGSVCLKVYSTTVPGPYLDKA